MEKVLKVRELEKLVITDPKNANSLIAIRKELESEDSPKDVRMAALHSLRRVFVYYLDSGLFGVTSKEDKNKGKKLDEFKKWLVQQLNAYQTILRGYIAANDTTFQGPSIRTLLEFVRRDHLISPPTVTKSTTNQSSVPATFGVRNYQWMLTSLLSVDDIDFDVIVMLRDEVFSKPDCAFYALLIFRNLLHDSLEKTRHNDEETKEEKQHAQSLLLKNCLDLLRFISVPTEENVLTAREGTKNLSILSNTHCGHPINTFSAPYQHLLPTLPHLLITLSLPSHHHYVTLACHHFLPRFFGRKRRTRLRYHRRRFR